MSWEYFNAASTRQTVKSILSELERRENAEGEVSRETDELPVAVHDISPCPVRFSISMPPHFLLVQKSILPFHPNTFFFFYQKWQAKLLSLEGTDTGPGNTQHALKYIYSLNLQHKGRRAHFWMKIPRH